MVAGVAHVPCAFDKGKFSKQCLDGLQVLLGSHVQHGVVLVFKLPVRFCAGVCPVDEVFADIVIAFQVQVWYYC